MPITTRGRASPEPLSVWTNFTFPSVSRNRMLARRPGSPRNWSRTRLRASGRRGGVDFEVVLFGVAESHSAVAMKTRRTGGETLEEDFALAVSFSCSAYDCSGRVHFTISTLSNWWTRIMRACPFRRPGLARKQRRRRRDRSAAFRGQELLAVHVRDGHLGGRNEIQRVVRSLYISSSNFGAAPCPPSNPAAPAPAVDLRVPVLPRVDVQEPRHQRRCSRAPIPGTSRTPNRKSSTRARTP